MAVHSAAVEEFLSSGHERQIDAAIALHDGEAEPWIAMWSNQEPVSLFGALAPVEAGRAAIEEASRWLASRFSDSRSFDSELVAVEVSNDLAYTVCLERSEFALEGKPVTGLLRVTTIYRRDHGEWRMVHRHGDRPPADARQT